MWSYTDHVCTQNLWASSSYRSSYLPAYLKLADSDVGRTRRISTEYYRRHLVMTACSKLQTSDAICWHWKSRTSSCVGLVDWEASFRTSATSETTLRSVFDWTLELLGIPWIICASVSTTRLQLLMDWRWRARRGLSAKQIFFFFFFGKRSVVSIYYLNNT